MSGNLKAALNDILRPADEHPPMPSPINASLGRAPNASSSHGGVSVRLTLLIAVVFAVIVFIAVRPILPFGSSNTAAKLAGVDHSFIDESSDEYRDPLFQPFVD